MMNPLQKILKQNHLELEDLTLFCSEVILLGIQEEVWSLCCIAYDDTFGFLRSKCNSREAPEGIWYQFPGGELYILVQRRYQRDRFIQSPVGQKACRTGQWIHGKSPRDRLVSGIYAKSHG